MRASLLSCIALLVGAGCGSVVRAAPMKADVVVAADGSGEFKSVQEAISAAPMRTGVTDPPWVILVKPGIYRERVYVQRERGNITVLGEDADKTIITGDLNANSAGPDGKPIGTFRTPTVQVDGDGMVWENLTIANGAGPVGQALALRVDGDRVIFRRCRFLGWQDTILVNRGRHYFADCYIEGHVDFIFGAATAYFDRCQIHCLKDGYITAASTPEGQAHGFVFADCTITGAGGVKTYLGRPWRNFAQTVFVRTQMSEVVRAEGWHNWNKPAAEKSARYAEFACMGSGARLAGRVPWTQKLQSGDSALYTPETVLAGSDGWRPVQGTTLHFAGDSTMADKPDLDYPERGWGQLFRELVRPPLRFVNHAVNGRSTKSFRDLGHWARLLAMLAPGDWVVIQFGHNDAKKDDPTRFTDPATDYRENLRRFVSDVRARGANPVLATSVVRRQWSKTGTLEDSHGPYLTAMRAVVTEENVPLLEMEGVTRALVTQLGPAGSKPLYLNFEPGELPRLPEGKHDNTHFTTAGARVVAALAAREMRRLQLPFADQLMIPDSSVWNADLGDGSYRNPVLHADYSDPDAIRVGDDYWMTSSSFSHVPGLPILHSKDLVNWSLVGHALPRLVPEAAFLTPQHGKGVWAPAIRYHAGRFWIYYPDPDFGLHFQDKAAYGRVVHLQPVAWKDDWPVIGVDSDGDGKGEPVGTHRKPTITARDEIEPAGPQVSDEFDSPILGLQWQWQANPQAAWYSLTARPGQLQLFSQAGGLYDAPHLLLQKFPASEFNATTKLEFAPRAPGDGAGLIVFGYDFAWLGLRAAAGGLQLVHAEMHDAPGKAALEESVVLPNAPAVVWVRVTVTVNALCQFAYSLDGQNFVPAGAAFKASVGRWVGAKVGLFAQAAVDTGARADFEWFRVEAAP